MAFGSRFFRWKHPSEYQPSSKEVAQAGYLWRSGIGNSQFCGDFPDRKGWIFMVLPLGIRTWTILDFYEPRKNDAARSLKSKSENHVYSSSIFTTYEIIWFDISSNVWYLPQTGGSTGNNCGFSHIFTDPRLKNRKNIWQTTKLCKLVSSITAINSCVTWAAALGELPMPTWTVSMDIL